MDTFSHVVPPGYRFHPTDEELVDYYLRKKVASNKVDLDVIKDVDLYKIEPWDLQEKCKIGMEEQNEWYFFSHKDKKYPTGTRTNRATTAGFWKATGRDKPIYTKNCLVGMRKTLVFYRGRAPNGRKTDWIIHEYRLQNNEHAPAQEEGWVVCRAFQKPMPNQQQRHACYAAAGYPAGYPTMPSYYYMSGGGGGGAAAPAALHADHHSLLAAAAESKLQVQLLADMPPLQSPAMDAAQSYEQALASAAESSAVDWNLLSSLLPSAQLNFHQPPASPSCSKNSNDHL